MTQLFRPRANVLSKLSIAAAVAFIGVLGAVAFMLDRSAYTTRQGVIIEQPVPFSHAHHVEAIGLDCRYCHSTVEHSSFAGIPSTETCMNCHTQIWPEAPMLEPIRASFRNGQPIEWVRVHNLPDFVRFDHSIHVAKGISCETCHGRVDQMPITWQENSLQMKWCLDCHRDPVPNIRPREEVFTMGWEPPEGFAELQRELAEKYEVKSLMSCSTCHY